MPKLLNRKQFVYEIKEMFYTAENFIYLICPYIDLTKDNYLTPAIEYANKKGIDINVIYSKGIEKRMGIEHIKKYKQVQLCYITDLHMKVYLSDKTAIIGSLNLLDFSIKNNLECGIIINRQEDLWRDVFTMIKKDVYKNMVIEKKREKIIIT